MDLINRYVHQVGRRLPKRLRADVEVELRSLLLDTLEERTGLQAGDAAPFSEDDQVAILEEFGPPAQMAAKYQPTPRHIIGPKLYDIYLIVVAAVVGAGLLATVVSMAVSKLYATSIGVETLALVGQALERFFGIALSGIGSTTLVFAVLERVVPDPGFRLDDEKEWNPRDLPAIEEQAQIKPAGLIVQIAILALLLIAVTAFPDRIGTGAYYDDGWHVVPSILSPEFFSLYLPLLQIRWSLTIVLSLVLLRQGRWQLVTRSADLLLHGFDVYILARLLLGPSILSSTALTSMLPAGVPIPPVGSALKLAFLVALVVTAVDGAIRLHRLLGSQAAPTMPSVGAQGPSGTD